MPRLTHHPLDAALVLLLGLSLPLPLQAATSNAGSAPALPGQTNPAANAEADRQPQPLAQPAAPQPTPTEPTPATPAPGPAPNLEPRLEGLEVQLKELRQDQNFALLKRPGSLLEILALAGLPLSILALALAMIQAQRSRRQQAALNETVQELRQEIRSRGFGAPVPTAQIQATPDQRAITSASMPLQETPLTISATASARLEKALAESANLDERMVTPFEAPLKPDVPLPPVPPQPPSINDWIAALNHGQRESLRGHASVQLNITKESEDAIQMGRSDATCLEDVSAGGSYLRVSCGEEHWLLPTERTLASFRTYQPSKGLFTYEPMISGDPKVLRACRLEENGKGWRVVAPGVIRVAG